jgi:hypothetical protein
MNKEKEEVKIVNDMSLFGIINLKVPLWECWRFEHPGPGTEMRYS